MLRKTLLLTACVAGLLLSPLAFAGAHYGADGLKPDKFGHRTGFKGNEEELGAAVAKAINDLDPDSMEDLDFTGHEKELSPSRRGSSCTRSSSLRARGKSWFMPISRGVMPIDVLAMMTTDCAASP